MKKFKIFLSAFTVCAILTIAGIITAKIKIDNNLTGFIPAGEIFETSAGYNNYMMESIKFPEISFKIHKIVQGDNFWKLSKENNLNIDTMLAFNPFWNDLLANVNEEVLIPTEKGAIVFIDDLDYIEIIKTEYNVADADIVIQKLPPFFKYYYKLNNEKENIAVFLKGVRPVIENMTAAMADKFELREMFQSPLGGRLSSFFGNRVHPIFNKRKFHNGIDIAAKYNTYVGAACEGKVIATGWMGGYGKAVIIEHKDGYKTLYGHLNTISTKPGRYVKAGQLVGKVGSTGYSTGPHLHFTLWKNGRLINPLDVLW